MGDLKPCPFCGLKEVSEYKTYVGCNRCNADGPTTMHDNQVELWNLRHSERTPAEKGGAKERDAEAVLRDLVRAQDALLRAYRLGDNGASAADRCRKLREELGRVDAKGGV